MTHKDKKMTIQQSILEENRDSQADSRREETLRFIHGIGHELKQPLGLIRAYSYYIKKNLTPDQEPLSQYPEKIDQQVDVITQMLNNVVDATKASTLTLTLHKEQFEILPFIKALKEEINSIFPTRKITFSPIKTSKTLCADQIRLQQALTNILINALKYSPEELAVTVSVKVTSSQLVIQIIDKGIGIPDADIPYLYNLYYRGTNSKSTGVKGLGLGLSLAKEILAMHSGNIDIASKLNQGTTVTVTLPLAV